MKLCPICLRNRKFFERHHVIARVDGGSDDPVNLMDICRICHKILSAGEGKAIWYYLACVCHQQIVYGLNFELRARNIGYVDRSDEIVWPLEKRASTLNHWTCQHADEYYKNIGYFIWLIAMGMIHGLVSGYNPDYVIRNIDVILEDNELWERLHCLSLKKVER